MCGPGGEIADVFVRWCIKYREGLEVNTENANKIAHEVDPRFKIISYTISKEEIKSKTYKKILLEIEKSVKLKKIMKYVGAYLLLPYESDENVMDFRKEVLLTSATVGGGCIFDSFASNKAKEAYLIFSFCDDSLFDQIRNNLDIWTSHYWYVHTNGKEGEHIEQTRKEIRELRKKEGFQEGVGIKQVTLTIPREEWSEKDDSKIWLFSRLQKGEVPDSPRYIRKTYSCLMKIKKQTKSMNFSHVNIKTPKKFENDKEMNMYIHNFLSVCAHVFGNSDNGIENADGDKLEFIMCFEKDD